MPCLYGGYDRSVETTHKTVNMNIPYRLQRNYIVARRAEYGFLGREIIPATGRAKAIGRFLAGARVAPIVIETLATDKDTAHAFWMAFAQNDTSASEAACIVREAITDHMLDKKGNANWRPYALALAWDKRETMTEANGDRTLKRKLDSVKISKYLDMDIEIPYVSKYKS